MSTLVVVEERQGAATADSLGLLALARTVDDDVRAAVLGAGVASVAVEVASSGAGTTYALDHELLADRLPEPRARALAALVREQEIETVLLPSSVLANDLAAMLAVELEAGLNWDLVALRMEGDLLVGRRFAFGDTVSVEVTWACEPRIGLVRAGTAIPASAFAPGQIVNVPLDAGALRAGAEVVALESVANTDGSLADADIVVAGGRGLGTGENFALLEELARELGGVVASSRAVVELGWYPRETQIGQTGTTVTPRLYVACGISGAIHHKVGMHRSETIVAINTDRSAPIFDFCDLGVVGDVTRIVPQLTALLRDRRTSTPPNEID
jgi:electron transfer flavoprotein alpha subunit